jgi:hypothetical protein
VQTAHGVTRPLDRPAPEYPTCAIISGPLYQVSYSGHGPHRCTSCRTCHLHTTRQANTILQMKQFKRKTKQNNPGFEFKPRQVNDSSQSKKGTNHLVSQSCRSQTRHSLSGSDRCSCEWRRLFIRRTHCNFESSLSCWKFMISRRQKWTPVVTMMIFGLIRTDLAESAHGHMSTAWPPEPRRPTNHGLAYHWGVVVD